MPIPSDGIIFAECPDLAGLTVVFRTPEARAHNPDRLNLDRRKLETCPLLEGETQLRLLNYQNNVIRDISNLHNLPHLIFLDLYNNKVSRIAGLEAVPALRVLMLGKNQISKIENMAHLSKLDVLDLHSNNITVIEGLGHLSDLRVLNLAGNAITEARNLEGLVSLTELNLRRNKLTSVTGLHMLPNVQRLFLSNNSIPTLASVDCVFSIAHLVELAIDGNPLTTALGDAYRQTIVNRVRSMKHLDLRRVTEDERRSADLAARREENRRRELERVERVAGAREYAIRTVQALWTKEVELVNGRAADEAAATTLSYADGSAARAGASPRSPGGGGGGDAGSAGLNSKLGEKGEDPVVDDEPVSTAAAAAAAAATAALRGGKNARSDVPVAGTPLAPTEVAYEQGGDRTSPAPLDEDGLVSFVDRMHTNLASFTSLGTGPSSRAFWELEVRDEAKHLRLFGAAFDALDDAKVEKATTVVSFMYSSFDSVLTKAARKLGNLSRLVEVRLYHTHLHSLSQLQSFAERVPASVTRLTIASNPVLKLRLFRPFTVHAFRNVAVLNGKPVTDEERVAAAAMFRGIESARAQFASAGPMLGRTMVTGWSSAEAGGLSLRGAGAGDGARGGGAAAGSGPSSDLAKAIVAMATASAHAESSANAKLRRQASDYVAGVVRHGKMVELRANTLRQMWPDLITSLVRQTLEDLAPMGRGKRLQAQLEALL